MLIYSEQRLVPTDVNMMVIAGMNGFFYVHRALYDQAVILDDIYSEEHELLIKAITNSTESRADVDRFFTEVPRPLNIFAPFLLLVKEEIEDIVDMIGAIHAMSGPINLRKMLKVPFDMRNTPSFSLSIRDEYQLAWDRFFMNTMPYGQEIQSYAPTSNSAPMNGTNTVTEPVQGELSNIGDDGVEYDDPLEALLFGCSDDIFDVDDDDEDEDDTEAKSEDVIPEQKAWSSPEEATPVSSPAPAPAPAPKTGLELLSGGFI